MSQPIFITNYESNGETLTATGSGPETIKLLKRLAKAGIRAKSSQGGEPEGKGGVYRNRDGTYGWWLKTIVRGKATK